MEHRRRALAMARERNRVMMEEQQCGRSRATPSPTHTRFDDDGGAVRTLGISASSPAGIIDVGASSSKAAASNDDVDVLAQYNSTELGSCRDCQSSEV